MLDLNRETLHEKELILNDIIKILTEMSSEWEMQFEGSLGPETLLGEDLALKSIDVVRLVVAIQDRYNSQNLPFQDLFMPNNRPVQDLQILDLVDFLSNHLALR
jgi:acyl carrier protein